MKKRYLFWALALAFLLAAQDRLVIEITKEEDRAAIAVPDFRGTGDAQPLMNAFNATLFADLQSSGQFRMAPKSMFPLQVPQRPEDFRKPAQANAPSNGLWLTDWAGPPVSANYLTIGYTAVQNGQLELYAYLYTTRHPDLANAQMLVKPFFGSTHAAGANTVAHEVAPRILADFADPPTFVTQSY